MDHCVECHVCHQWYDVTMNSGVKKCCIKCYMKEYRQKNKEKILHRSKEWNKNNKEKSKKSTRISEWKKKGLICENYDQVYELWLDSTHCDKCGCQYTKKNHKDMEHCHTTGAFRGIVCHKCNMNMLDKKKPTTNTSGHKNIGYNKLRKKYEYRKRYYGKTRTKYFKTLSQALCWKYIMLLRMKAGQFD